MDKIEKIDCTTCKYGYEDERLGIPMCHHPLRFSKDCVDFNMHEGKHLDDKSDKSLEEAAEKYRRESYSKSILPNIDGPMPEYGGNIKAAFIAGWKCRDDQMPMPEDTVLFNKGVAEGRRLEREDMLKDAVEGYVNYYEDSGGILVAEAQVGCPYHNGDKVRIVVLKEKEE